MLATAVHVPRVLIVDDDPNNRRLLEVMLATERVHVQTAADGAEALAMVAQQAPDLILLDVMMSGMDGYAVAAAIKGDAATKTIPIIMVTVRDDREAKMRGLRAGAEDFLSMPVDRAELCVRVRNLLRLKAYSDDHDKYGQLLETEVGSRTAALIESEARYRRIVETAGEGIWQLDDQGTTTFLNTRMAEMLGYQVSELIGRPPGKVLDEEGAAQILENLEQMRCGERASQVEVRFKRKDGTALWTLIGTSAICTATGTFEGVLAMAMDITARKQTEEAQREAERRFRRLSDSGIIGVAVASVNGTLLEANDTLLEMLGYTQADVTSGRLTWRQLTPPDLEDNFARVNEDLLQRGRVVPWEKQYLRKDGTRVPVLVGVAALDEQRHISVVSDLTQRTLAEERKAAVVNAAFDAVVVMDGEGTISESNPTAEHMFGYAPGALLGRPLADLVHPPRALGEDERGLANYVAVGVDPVFGIRHELVAIRADGVSFPVELSISRVRSGVASSFVGFIRDISDRKQAERTTRGLEEQLRQAQKMEAVGRLAGGVAHDFNNLLSVVLSYADLAIEDLAEADPIRRDVEEIRAAGLRAADLTRQLLMFSRQQIIEPRVLDLNEVLSRMDAMLRRIVGEDVALATLPGVSLGCVRADPGSLDQVIMNLVINARDAMPTGGRITMETANVELDAQFAGGHLGVTPGPHVMIAVSDTGTGMDAATLGRIFEPFFTTKEKGKGTGLGLSTVFGIVQQSGGTTWVYSELGKGTTFKVYLPRVDALPEAIRLPREGHPARGCETVLLVEDEDQVRDVARGILRRCGYTVIEARNGGEALLLCEQATPIDLLLSDVVMPGISGLELARRLGRARPHMKVLCMSGYTDDSAVRHGVIDAHFAYLQKPFTVDTLARKVREVLDGPPATPPE